MNDFYYVLIKNNGDVIHDIFATSHKDLIGKYITPEDLRDNTFFKAMYSPKNNRLDDVDNYQLIISETFVPDWFVGALAEDIMYKLRTIIESMIIRIHKPLILHEGVILVGNAIVEESKHSIIFAMYDKSRIKTLDCNSEVYLMTDDGSIDEMRDNTIIKEMCGFSKIKTMYSYSKIYKMYGQAKIGVMNDHSRIAVLKGDANIVEMRDEAQADRLKHMSSVDEMHEFAVIEEMWDWTVVDKMFDNSRINSMNENSIVMEMHGNALIEEMSDNAVVERLCENSLVRKLSNRAQILRKEII